MLDLRYATSQPLLFPSQLSLVFTFNSARGHPVNLCLCLLQIYQSDCRSQFSRVVFIQSPSVSPGLDDAKEQDWFSQHNTAATPASRKGMLLICINILCTGKLGTFASLFTLEGELTYPRFKLPTGSAFLR